MDSFVEFLELAPGKPNAEPCSGLYCVKNTPFDSELSMALDVFYTGEKERSNPGKSE